MFEGLVLFIIIVGTFALVYTILGAASGRSLNIGLILAGLILVAQFAAVGYSIASGPPSKPDDSEQTEPEGSPEESPSAFLQLTR